MSDADQKQYLRSLQRTASGGRQTGVQKATAASLAALKIKVETIPLPEKKPRKRPAKRKAVAEGR